MNNREQRRLLKRRIKLILEERSSAVRAGLMRRWELWVARAELFEAARIHEHRQSQLEPEQILDGAEVVSKINGLEAIESDLIRRKAYRYQIFIPENFFTEVEIPYVGYRKVLTEDGLAEILPKIQEASRLRSREIGYWISLSIGLIGAISGLVALIV